MKELFNIDYLKSTEIMTPSKSSKTQQNSPVARPRNISKLVDKNLLDIGNATLKMKDNEGNTRIVKTKPRNNHHGHTPTL